MATKASVGSSMKDLVKAAQKEHGEGVANYGGFLPQAERAPSGIFNLDIALGGGFPKCRASTVFGPESSGKTNVVLRTIKQNQILHPEQTNVFVALEPFDQDWAKKMGVDTDKLVVIYPDTAEKAVDMIESALYTDDCGILAVDSLGALIGQQEIEGSAEKANPGGTGLVTGKLVRKTTLALNEAEKKGGNMPTLLYINQIRHKVGVMFGSPETSPGGFAPLFQSSIRLRLYGKNVFDNKISKVMPLWKETVFTLAKWKVPVLSASGKFQMAMIPHNGYLRGDCEEDSTIKDYLEMFGLWEKGAKKGYKILGTEYDTQQAFFDAVAADAEFAHQLKDGIIAKLVAEGKFLEAEN